MNKIDEFHYHEIIDRCNTIMVLIDEILIDQIGMDIYMNKRARNAQENIYDVMNNAALLKEQLIKKGK